MTCFSFSCLFHSLPLPDMFFSCFCCFCNSESKVYDTSLLFLSVLFLCLPDIAPVIEGAVQHIASRRLEVGGIDLTKLLVQELGKSNPGINISIADAEKLKEKYSCCAEDEIAYKKIISSNDLEEKHTLPDGQVSK